MTDVSARIFERWYSTQSGVDYPSAARAWKACAEQKSAEHAQYRQKAHEDYRIQNDTIVRQQDRIAELETELANEVKNKKEFERDWLEACDEISALKAQQKPVGVVKLHSGSLKDIAVIVWHGKQPPVGTELYARPVPPDPVVPEGWKLVPIEPTEKMLLAYTKCRTTAGEEWAKHQWCQMLSAAPEYKGEE